MNINKLTLVSLAALTIVGTGLMTTNVSADETDTHPRSTLVERIASQFNLNKDEVQTVFDQVHTERQAERQADHLARLDQLVTDGSITADQKQLIIAKHEEMQALHESRTSAMQDMTREERRATMQSEHDLLQTWAEENGIDLQYLIMGHGQGRPGRGYGHGFGPNAEF